MNIYEAIKTLEAAQITMESLSTDNHRLTAELATERRSNEKTYDHNNRLINEVDRLTAEVEKWKSIAQQINTDWIPANQALAEEVERLKELVCSTTLQRNEYFGKLSRYEAGVEVEGVILLYDNEVHIESDVRDYPVGHGLDIGQRVRVLVMPCEDEEEG